MTWTAAVVVAAVVLAVGLLTLGVVLWRRQVAARSAAGQGPTGGPAAEQTAGSPGPLIVFVANPTKPDVAGLRTAVLAACAAEHVPEPLWWETSAEEPGVRQAREAVARGADLVVAVGGDGTVRAVAEGLVGTPVPMALIPLGTGNLLARNLDLPLTDPMESLRVALTGRDRAIDVGWLRVDRWESQISDPVAEAGDGLPAGTDIPRDHIFLVIAGLGFDAAMVADADEQLKARVGWIAYFMAGVKHLRGYRSRVHVELDDGPTMGTRVRSLLIGNCGRLPGNITLLPDAVLDDGWLDIAAIDTRAGIAGWVQLLGEVVLQGLGMRHNDLPKIGRIDHARARRVHVRVPGSEQVQVDGEIVGRVKELTAWVDPGALVVRVAA